MAHYLPSGGTADPDSSSDSDGPDPQNSPPMADLKVFWGPEICRLEYLVHLLDTGRIKDEHWPDNVA